MRGTRDHSEMQAAERSRPGVSRQRALTLSVLLLFLCLALSLLLSNRRASAFAIDEDLIEPQPDYLAASLLFPSQDYSRFSHSYPGAHAALSGRWSCSICHTRRDNSPEPRFPEHKDCTNCHLAQFTTPNAQMCSICHTADALNQPNPPLKQFPRLRSFFTEFDHAQHAAGEARPEAHCAACHAPMNRGIAKTIPAGLSAHQTCFQCHTPNRQSRGVDISSCGACHGSGRHNSTSTASRAFRLGFSHADHDVRRNLNCENCHTVGRRGLPQSRQVSSTVPSQHFPNTRAQSCLTCHNGQRTFGEANFNDCKRCHTGRTFRL